MEITSFVLGVLAIVTVAMVAVIVVGIVKILKLTKQLNYVGSHLNVSRDELYRYIDDNKADIWRQFDTTGRDITMVEKTIMDRIDDTRREMDIAINDLYKSIGHESSEGRRYTDSRIDKLIDTYFEHVGTNKLKKEVING